MISNVHESSSDSKQEQTDSTEQSRSNYQLVRDRVKRTHAGAPNMYGFGRVNKNYQPTYAINVSVEIDNFEPQSSSSYQEAISCDESVEWIGAIHEELLSFRKECNLENC